MYSKDIMLVGLGDLGGHVLEMLARYPRIGKILTADVREDWGVKKTNSAIIGAEKAGLYPDIEFVKMNLNNIDKSAEIIKKFSPKIIYNSVTLQSWWVITELPKEKYKEIDKARFGPWLPMHLSMAYKLMQAVKESGIDTHVINAAFPDAVNPVLDKVGLAPTVGIGNIDNIVPSFKMTSSKLLQVPLRSVDLYLVAPHFFSYHVARFGEPGGAPYYLKIMVEDKDVTEEIDREDLFSKMYEYSKRPGGREAHPVVASSVVKIILGILYDTQEIGHAPGPNGLPGGYPIRLTEQGVEVFLPEGILLEEAIKINKEAQELDGIEEIKDDGTVIITDKPAQIMKDLLGFECKEMRLSDMDDLVEDLDRRFKEWASEVS